MQLPSSSKRTTTPRRHTRTHSFALMVLECITEERPFSHIEHDAAVLHTRISERQLPPRPDGKDKKKRISDDLWKLMTECWDLTPERRPPMGTVHNFLSSVTASSLNGKIEKVKKIASEGIHCEVWVGQWRKGGTSGEVEKVSPNLTASTLLIGCSVGGLENTPNVWVTGGG